MVSTIKPKKIDWGFWLMVSLIVLIILYDMLIGG